MANPKDPGAEAWELMFELLKGTKRERFQLGQEYGLSPMQLVALSSLEPGEEMPMSSLADMLFCDASNVTGIVDRLEARGLIQRRAAARDRRVKLLGLTDEGVRLRQEVTRRMHEPPAEIASLSLTDKRALRDTMRRALARRQPKAA
jgi:DNA-binding MarR family transcriptional regulator